ncbi:hypothetical protein NCCP2716_27880 [Sporosarcina sp. NCCP-2716]|uniref:hypothetical protein n=1 Tax=Sporosarcina sp. NCCP-2716 TaxID=2943679 RepID=UPI00203EF97D|nr:hypothetical protein [Sporosarcina sp. NCCP-2716]GKV70290.1 hypothetical protein NCCP2716_27880 [Sporosarcina sp. NCCP-2716]
MKTLKVENGDLVLNENGELAMVDGDQEVAQSVMMNLAIQKGEFPLDEFIGLDTSFLQEKRVSEEEMTDSVLGALQVMTDQNIIEGAEDITMSQHGRVETIGLRVLLADGSSIDLTGGGRYGA